MAIIIAMFPEFFGYMLAFLFFIGALMVFFGIAIFHNAFKKYQNNTQNAFSWGKYEIIKKR